MNIPNSVTSIKHHAFSNCVSLTTVLIGSSVNSIGDYVFSSCEKLQVIYVSDDNETYSSKDGVLFDKALTKLIVCPAGKKGVYTIPNTVTSIEDWAFESCSGLTSVVIPNSVTTIGHNAFEDCTGLTSMTLPNSVTSMLGCTFLNCTGLRSVTLSESLTRIYGANFDGCTSLTSIEIPDKVTSIGDDAFNGCPSLTSVIIPNSVTSIGQRAFASCSGLTSVVIGEAVTSIGYAAFVECPNLNSVTIFAKKPPTCTNNHFGNSSGTLYVPSESKYNYERISPWKNFSKIEVIVIPATDISLDKVTMALPVGSIETISANVFPTNTTDKITWTSDNEVVATVNYLGVVTAKSVGNAKITATVGEKNASCTVTVDPILATAVTLSKTSVNINVGGSETITAAVEPNTTTDKSIVWTSSDESVATVVNGKITALKVGTAKITATCGSVKSGECTVTVSPVAVESVTISPAEKTIKIGESFTLTATVKPDNATDKSVTYSITSGEGIVSISGNTVIGLKVGEATITAKAGEKTATCKVTVNPIPAESITIEPEAVKLDVGEGITLKATVLPANTTYPTVTWKSSKPEIAKVDATTGVVTAIATGTANITASCGELVTKTCVVTVNPVLAKTVTIIAPAKQVMVRDKLQLTATVAPDNTTDKTLTWSSGNNEIATVDQNGEVSALIPGKVTITAKSKANPSVFGTIQIEVIPRSKEIDGVIYEMVYVNPGSVSDNDYIKVIGCVVGQPASGALTIQPQIRTSFERTLPVKEVDKDAFNGNAAITSIVIPKSVSKVSAGAFANCTNLNAVRIDDSAESLECGDGMFDNSPFVSLYLGRHTSGTVLSGHKSLDDLQIGALVTEIDANEFTGCAPITDLVVYATTPPTMPDNGFDQSVYDNTELRVPDDVVDEYKTAPGWKKFNQNNILGINQTPAESISLTPELTLTVGGSKKLEVEFNPTDVTSKALYWSSSNEDVASVSSTGVVVALTPGEATITATTTNGKTAECKVTVNPIKVTMVTVEPAVAEITVGDVLSLSASVDPDDATDQTIEWSSSDAAVATVDADGNVKAIAPGSVVVTAKSTDGPTAECTITVVAATIDVQDIVLDVESMSLREGGHGVIKAHIYPENASDQSVTWRSSEPEVATVDESGNVTALKQGMTMIEARTANGLSAECMVTVTPAAKPATGITLNLSQVELLQWEEVQLIATVTPAESDDEIVWTTTDMIVANVDDYGKVTSFTPGTVTITATTSSGVSASCQVTVVAAPTGINLDRNEVDVIVGGELQLNAEVLPSDAAAHKLTWRSSTPEIATVDMQGKVKGIAPGSATITVRTVNGLEVGCTVNVKTAPTSIALNFTHYDMAEQDRLQLIALVEPTGMTYSDVTWSTSDEQVVSVTGDGWINSISQGTAIITATTVNGLTATCAVTVKGYDVRMNVLSATLYRGEQLPLTVKVTPARGYYASYNWSSSDEGVATVDNDGTVTGVEVGMAYINYYVGSSGYDYCPVIVIDRNPVEEGPEITFSEVAVRPGQSLELGNTVDPEVTWTSSDESVIKVDDNGNIVAVGEGEATVTATDASGSTSSCSVVVATQAPIPVMDIFFNGDQTLQEGETLQLMPEIYPYEAYNKSLTYDSSDPEVVAVDEDGVIKALRPGEAVITATTSNGLIATCVVFVEAKPSGIESVTGDSAISVMVEGQEIVVVAPDDADVEVYALTGVLVRRTREHRISDLTRGVYVVRVAGKAFKVSL